MGIAERLSAVFRAPGAWGPLRLLKASDPRAPGDAKPHREGRHGAGGVLPHPAAQLGHTRWDAYFDSRSCVGERSRSGSLSLRRRRTYVAPRG